jgi:DNA-binding transcriptional LysR family regulator
MRALDLTRHEADLALRALEPRGADLVITKVLRARSIVAASEPLVRELGRLRSWSDAPWIAWDRDLASFAPSVWLAKYARGAAIALRTNHMGAQLRAAETGLGAMIVPEPYLATHALVPVRYGSKLAESASKLPVDDLWLVGHRSTRDTPRIAAVWEFLAVELRALGRSK